MKKCGTDCIAASACCRVDGCCAHTDCPRCQKCVSGSCVNQASTEDLKKECLGRECHPPSCDGKGACDITPNGQNGPSCDGQCQKCQAGVCTPQPDRVTPCGTPAGCTTGNQTKEGDSCLGGKCEPGAMVACTMGKTCQGNVCSCPTGTILVGTACFPCGQANQRCCSGNNCGEHLRCGEPLGPPSDTPVCLPCGSAGKYCCGAPGFNCDPGLSCRIIQQKPYCTQSPDM
jgi:hypothetical protein